MTIPAGTFRATLRFALGGVEIAMMGFHLHWDSPAIDDEDIQDIADHVRDTFLTEFGPRKSMFSTAVAAETVILEHLDNTPGPNHLHVLYRTESAFGAGAWVGESAESMPWECSAVVSLAAYPQGGYVPQPGRHRGRFYLPPLAIGLISANTGQLPAVQAGQLADAAADWLSAINSDVNGEPLQVVVLSRANDSVYPVEHIWVDTKIDSQRRRENRQPSTGRESRNLS